MNISVPETAQNGGQPVRPYAHFVARQPILHRDEAVFGYELLFRDGIENYFRNADPEAASCGTLDTTILMGLDVLCGRSHAFVNCTHDLLLNDSISLLPPAHTVVEVLETVEPDELVRAACLRLKAARYKIALDDFAVNDPRQSLTDLADIIKVDLMATSIDDAAAMVKRYGSWRCQMLAEKVETRDQFVGAKKAGFQYFQGYFFRRPELMAVRDIPANGVNYLRMLRAASRAELDTNEIESVIKSEASLCYRLLRYLNSAMFGFSNEIRSVRHALAILGEHQVRRWIFLVATVGAGQKKSSELVLLALVRARFCDLLSPKVPDRNSDLFLMGLISMMDALLDTSMTKVLEHVPLHYEMKNTLLGGTSPLQPLYQLMLAQESGEWNKAVEIAKGLRIAESDVAQAYWQAMQWARQVTAAELA